MSRTEVYTDLRGRVHSFDALDADERALVEELKDSADRGDWYSYSNFWMARTAEFYKARGMSRPDITKTLVFRIAQDLGSRLAVEAGLARAPDYRDELEQLIQSRFRTRREFCEATGISEDMLSHVLAKRKHLAITTLAEGLERIGYGLHIAPLTSAEPNRPRRK